MKPYFHKQNPNSIPLSQRLLERWQPNPEAVLFGTALVVGILTGIGAVLFRYLIDGVARLGYEWIPKVTSGMGKAYIIFVPAIGGLLVGLLVYNFAREAKGHGVPEVMEAVALKGGRIRPRVAIVKSFASSLTIGSGGSAGREGPIVQIGSAIGSSIGQAFHMSDERISNLVACGAASGIAATFNAPIAGVIFALEVILGRFSVRSFSSVVISAVSASVIGRVAFGDVPAFAIPTNYGVNSLWEFLFYPILGVLAALVGAFYTKALYFTEDIFDDIKQIPEWFKPAVGGVLLGILTFVYPLASPTQSVNWTSLPQIYNVGYNIIESALANGILFNAALILLIAKIFATCFTLGSGGSGGVFAPSLFIGAMLGTMYELALAQIVPGVSAPPGAYALVGMAALFAASAHAPITAVLILFELTGDYRIILPLMLTVVVATVISHRLLKGESIYSLKLSRRGVRLVRGRVEDILESVKVDEVMTQDYATIDFQSPITELAELFVTSHHHGLMVMDENNNFWGIVTLADLERVMENQESDDIMSVAKIATPLNRLIVTYPDEPMSAVLERMGTRDLGRLPVVNRDDPQRLLGLIWREAIIKAYNLALARQKHR